MIEPIDIIIPTYDNPQYLLPCIQSIMATRQCYPINLIIVNNGRKEILDSIPNMKGITIIQPDKNLGWEGGLKEGLKISKSEFVLFCNDDILIPFTSYNWLRSMVGFFKYKNCGAVGPVSNCVMGMQNIFNGHVRPFYLANFLIGYCMLVRREALDLAGGVDDTLPGGDDIDLSIRLRKAGYKLAIDSDSFVYHHGFKTGVRVYGDSNVDGGWNSMRQSEETTMALIRKHGLRCWYEHMFYEQEEPLCYSKEDQEGDRIRKFVKSGKILEVGCGGQKTVPDSIGLDMIPKGENIETIGQISVADIVSDAQNPQVGDSKFDTIIARHILEHCQDPVETLKRWAALLNDDGTIFIAVPNDELHDTIPLNPEHKHSFTISFLRSVCEMAGLFVNEIVVLDEAQSLVCEAKVKSRVEAIA